MAEMEYLQNRLSSISWTCIHQKRSRIILLSIWIPSPCLLFSNSHCHCIIDQLHLARYQFPGYIMQNGGATNANKNLSDTDKAVLVLNYARLDPGPLVSEWTVAHAADVIGIKGEWREKIVAATHPQDIRRLYSDWSKSPQRDQQGEA